MKLGQRWKKYENLECDYAGKWSFHISFNSFTRHKIILWLWIQCAFLQQCSNLAYTQFSDVKCSALTPNKHHTWISSCLKSGSIDLPQSSPWLHHSPEGTLVLMVHPGSTLHACQSPAPGRKTSDIWYLYTTLYPINIKNSSSTLHWIPLPPLWWYILLESIKD